MEKTIFYLWLVCKSCEAWGENAKMFANWNQHVNSGLY